MSLIKEQIESNKQEFITLLRSIKREKARIEELIAKLEDSDFFTAPASTKYHGAFEGGLCEHVLNVYYNMMHIFNYKIPILGYQTKDIENITESIVIVALLHDISKMNIYTTSSKNVKVYSDSGSKHDELGNFDWKTQLSYTLKEPKDRFIFGSHEMNSEYMVSKYIPLTVEESVAILHHMGGMAWDSSQDNITEVYNKYPLAIMLHVADMLSCYIDESV